MSDSEKVLDPLGKRLNDVHFDSRMSHLYHEQLISRYRKIFSANSILTMLLSTASIAALFEVLPHKEIIVGAAVAVIATLNAFVLASGLLSKIELHSSFRRRWLFLEKQALKLNSQKFTSVKIAELELEQAEIDAEESQLIVSDKFRSIAHQKAIESLGLDRVVTI